LELIGIRLYPQKMQKIEFLGTYTGGTIVPTAYTVVQTKCELATWSVQRTWKVMQTWQHMFS